MDKQTPQTEDYNKPVAYDANGNPLYAHPPAVEAAANNGKIQNVHFMRSREPVTEEVSDIARLKHQQSKKIYPGLNLSEGEYVITSVRRSPIGLIMPTALGFVLIIFAVVLFAKFDLIIKPIFPSKTIGSADIFLPVVLFIIMVLLANYIIYVVYNKNSLYLTNESLIQHIQTTIFSKQERVISLMDIEDVSFTQKGMIQSIFNYGSLKLSTEGQNATYFFTYANNPKETVSNLSNAIEAFKYGRVVTKSQN